MGKKRVLSVGQCSFDHRAINQLIEERFGAEVVAVDNWAQAKSKMADDAFDLMLVNRKLDCDYTDGLDVIRSLKADPNHAELPVMMVTNFPEHQQLAIEAGAKPGFGKLELAKPETIEKLRCILEGDEAATS